MLESGTSGKAEMIGKIKDFSVTMDGRQILTIELQDDFRSSFDDLKDKQLDITLKQHREKRSNDANAYFWSLCQKLGEKTDIPAVDIYREMIRETNVFRDVTIDSQAVETLRHAWSLHGLGWQTEIVDSNGAFTMVRLWYGSSTYNTKQMSKLINMAVDECKAQGIETMTPEELKSLIEEWRR